MKKKILSLLTAFAMVFGIIAAPFTTAIAAEEKAGTPVAGTASEETTTTVTLHKIKVSSLDGLPITTKNETETAIVGEDGTTEYTGNKINIQDFFGTENRTVEELAGVKFVYWVFDDQEKYEAMVDEPTSYETVEAVDKHLGKEGVTKKEVTSKKGGVALDDITVLANENRFVWAVETSKVIPGEGEDAEDQTITGMKAVPFGLALPLFNAKGEVNTDLHVYPKNTTAKEPKVDKDFEGKANAKKDRLEITGQDAPIVKDVNVGDKVPYDIETLIPAGAQYKTTAWTDQMTEGLTFNDDVKIMIGAKDSEEEWAAANYTVKKDENGFVLELTEAGLKAINGSKEEIRLLVKYSATVNENAKVERPERNDVIFHYGNEPHHGNTPYPTKPSNGELTVNKEFSDAQGAWKPGEKVEVTIYDAHTGKPVEFTDGQSATVELTKGDTENNIEEKLSHTWTGLDNDKQYKVVEKFTPGDEVTYEKQPDETVKIIDKKTDNPTPKNPEEPAVKTYGHRFQKIDQTNGKGLKDAEFVVKNGNGQDAKYLKEKTNNTKNFDQAAYAKAEKEYKDAVKEGKEDTEIANLKKARDKAYVTVNTQWEFTGTSKEDAYVFKSDVDGYFKVTGLNKGTYYLEEKKAPKGYAEIKEAQEFTVAEGSTGKTELQSDELKDEVGFLQINNKKVTIPQTGGIGSVIFIVAGLAIMAGAFVAYKRSQAQEA